MKKYPPIPLASYALALMTTAVLTACGGTASSLNPSNETTPTTPTVPTTPATPTTPTPPETPTDTRITLSGIAAKGLISHGLVTVYQINTDGTLTALKSGITGSDGRYSISGVTAAAQTLLVVKVTAQDNGETRMQDEATGTAIVPAAGFELAQALTVPTLPAPGPQTLTATLTPYTTVAYQNAVAQASNSNTPLTAEIIRQNAEKVSAAIKSPINDEPTFDASGKPTNTAAILLATVSQLAKEDSLGCDTGSQASNINCVVTALAKDGLSTPATITAINSAKQAVAPDDTSTVALAIPPATGAGSPASNATPTELAKKLVASLRSNALSFEDSASSNDLRDTVEAFKTQVNNAMAPVDSQVVETANLIDWASIFLKSGGTNNSGNACGYYTDTTFNTASSVPTNIVSCARVDRSDSFSYYDSSTQTYRYYAIRTRIGLASKNPGTDTQFEAYKGSRVVSCSYFDGSCVKTSAARSDGIPFSVTLEKSASGSIKTLTITGKTVASFRIADVSNGQFIVDQRVADSHDMSIRASLTDVDSAHQRLEFNGHMAGFVSGAVDSQITVGAGSYLQISTYSANNSRPQKGLLILDVSARKSALSGRIEVPSMGQDSTATVFGPSRLMFSGSATLDGSQFLEGSLIATMDYSHFDASKPEASDNHRPTTLAFTGKMTVPTRPVLSLSLTASNPLTDQALGALVYSQGDVTVNVSMAGSKDSAALKFSTPEGLNAAAIKTNGVWSGSTDITFKGDKVAVYDHASKKVVYSDGTFEQF